MKVMIAGAGSVGSSIAKELISHGHEVLLIDEALATGSSGAMPEQLEQLEKLMAHQKNI